MATNIQVYSNANSTSMSCSVDFVGNVLVSSLSGPSSAIEYYFQISTSSKTDSGAAIPVKIIKDLGTLALNGSVQSASNTTADYIDIDSMITDYVYDIVHGHTANQFSSGCSVQRPIKFK